MEGDARTFLLQEMGTARTLEEFSLAYLALNNYKQLVMQQQGLGRIGGDPQPQPRGFGQGLSNPSAQRRVAQTPEEHHREVEREFRQPFNEPPDDDFDVPFKGSHY